MKLERHHPDTTSAEILHETIQDVNEVSRRCLATGDESTRHQLNTIAIALGLIEQGFIEKEAAVAERVALERAETALYVRERPFV